MAYRQDRSASANHEINMTPLIDVSLVLVVMLLLATPLAFESSIDVRGGAGSAKAAAAEERNTRIELAIVSEDSVRVNRSMINHANLTATLMPLLSESETRGVTLTCNPAVSHRAFVDVLDRTKLAGVIDIAVVER